MEFSEKLVILMNIYRISNSKVAKGVRVDPSLISRWKSGERLPARGSNAEKSLAAFLSMQKMLPTDRRVLSLTLGTSCETPEQTYEAIKDWLLNPEAGIAPLNTDSTPADDDEDTFDGDIDSDDTDVTIDEDTDAETDEDAETSQVEGFEDEDESPDEPFEYIDSDDLEPDIAEEPERTFESVPKRDPGIIESQALDALNTLLLDPPKAIENRPVNLWPRVMKGLPFDHELFKGTKGKRQAAINFLHSVLSYNKVADVYMMSQENSQWISEDPVFADLWSGSLLAMARQGHKIHMIHATNGNSGELPEIIRNFMPLYASGGLSSYYRKNHRRDFTLPTIFVARGLRAVVSYCPSGQKNAEYTVLYNNDWDTIVYEELFNTYLEDSRLLVSSCARRGVRAYAEQIAIFEHGAGERTLLKNSLSGLWMSEQTLYKYMSRQIPPQEISFFLDIFARRRENFENVTGTYKWVELISKTILDTIAQNGTCMLPGHELFCSDNVTLDGEDLKIYLSGILRLLESHENFEVILLEDMPVETNMMLLRGKSACFTSAPDPKNPTAVIIGEEVFLDSVERHFDAILTGRDRDELRKETMSEISGVIAALNEPR